MIFQTTKAIKDLGDQVDQAEKEKVESLVKELEKALEGQDLDLIKEKKEALEKDAQNIAVKAYEQASKAKEAEANTTDKNDSNTVDAEFEKENIRGYGPFW